MLKLKYKLFFLQSFDVNRLQSMSTIYLIRFALVFFYAVNTGDYSVEPLLFRRGFFVLVPDRMGMPGVFLVFIPIREDGKIRVGN